MLLLLKEKDKQLVFSGLKSEREEYVCGCVCWC